MKTPTGTGSHETAVRQQRRWLQFGCVVTLAFSAAAFSVLVVFVASVRVVAVRSK